MDYREVWLGGKGPTLMKYDWSKAGKCRIGINHAAFLIPECYGAFAIDYEVLDIYKEKLPKNIIIYKKKTYKHYNFEHETVIWNKDEIIQDCYASTVIAIQLFYSLGARIIHMIGFDSIDNNLDRPQEVLNLMGKDKGDTNRYNVINEHIFEVLKRFPDLKIIWEHRNV